MGSSLRCVADLRDEYFRVSLTTFHASVVFEAAGAVAKIVSSQKPKCHYQV